MHIVPTLLLDLTNSPGFSTDLYRGTLKPASLTVSGVVSLGRMIARSAGIGHELSLSIALKAETLSHKE